jgi:hypothetical protein
MPSETELAGIARYEREEAAFTASGLALAHDELLSIGSMKRAIHESRDWTSNFRSSTIRASLASRLIQAVRSGRGHSKIEESSRMRCSLISAVCLLRFTASMQHARRVLFGLFLLLHCQPSTPLLKSADLMTEP